jgi:hypothetical protein
MKGRGHLAFAAGALGVCGTPKALRAGLRPMALSAVVERDDVSGFCKK